MATGSKRGRLSSSDRDRIHELAQSGYSVEEIAEQVERRKDVVESVLGAAAAAAQPKKARRTRAQAAPQVEEVAQEEGENEIAEGMLQHFIWLRSGVQVELVLPADLTQAEAERLSVMVRNLPFTEG